ncbi:peptidoglycan DD-metalloendopeptidase family protein [Rhodocyclus tenuis]|uniref:M23 family metallopeptidase n=1 Tax=Rhodocyclus gracilis TaxID=2929842 RepID=UPI00129891B2|nr:peptidoglycan DD-metalloendopeptidase family protein [Rhodocyclus gracilis]MRD73842.1 peptidoglycan DD-metalloendopeptidase family protein [Rhodocyclus gracilis]
MNDSDTGRKTSHCEGSAILAQSHPAIDRLARLRWPLSIAGACSLLGMVTAFAIAPSDDKQAIDQRTVVETLNNLAPTLIASEGAEFLHEDRILRGDTLSSLLLHLGVDDRTAFDFLTNNSDAHVIARQLRPGKSVSARTGANGELRALYFPLNGKDATLIVERNGEHFSAREEAMALQTQTHFKSGEIRYSLFGATDSAGIPDAIATQLADVFGADIDFLRDLRKGDRFSVVYEMLYYKGQAIRSGRILAAEFVNNQKTYTAFWYAPDNSRGGYYTRDGQNLRKAFLRSPLEFSRVTSGFTTARFHPILQTWRAHKGIDYGAPIGTRVRSVADGTVEFAGQQNGYGNLIVVRHAGAYSSAYGHLSGFGPGIRKGAHVAQSDTLGYVGMTGMATGPHLHYEFRVNGQQVNPLALNLPASLPLEPTQMAAFRRTVPARAEQLGLAKQVTVAASE